MTDGRNLAREEQVRAVYANSAYKSLSSQIQECNDEVGTLQTIRWLFGEIEEMLE